MSEEAKVKSKQELIKGWESAIEAAEFYGKGKEERLISYMKDFVSDLNQLDEPDTREQLEIVYKDILSRREFLFDDKRYVVVEKPEIPKEVGERIKQEIKRYSLYQSLNYAYNYEGIGEEERRIDEWVIENTEGYAQAWLNEFTADGIDSAISDIENGRINTYESFDELLKELEE